MRKMTSRQITRCAGLVRALEEVRVTRDQFEDGIRKLPPEDRAYYQRVGDAVEHVTTCRGHVVSSVLYDSIEQQDEARQALVVAQTVAAEVKAERMTL